jgi:L-ascorbate metabolism protein UlaG (beta-lactamase superfamily)
MAITIIVTNAGRAALVNAANTGTNAVTIAQLGITAAVFVPNAAQVALPGEIKRIASVAGVVVDDDKIHVTASDVTNAAYTMRGFGLYLADGTLFATYGQAGEILNKTSESMMLLALDIGFVDVDAQMIVFGDTNFILPPATTEILGLVELATTAEGQAGNDPTRVLTPMVGKQSVLGWLLSQDGSGSGLDADLLDGLHATAFASAGHSHDRVNLSGFGSIAAQNAEAVNITGGGISGTTLNNVQGNVGIGTAAPGAKLQVGGAAGATPAPTQIRLDTTYVNTSTPTNQQLKICLAYVSATEAYGITPDSDARLWYHAGSTAVGNGAHVFATGGTARVIIGAAGMTINGQTAWHAGNDGAGSGLDADLLDGLHASAFASAGHSHDRVNLTGFGNIAAQNAEAVNITGGGISGTTLNNVQGNVGIGTAAPGAKLQVGGLGAGPTAAPTQIRLDGSYTNTSTPTNQQLKLNLLQASATEAYGYTVDASGRIWYHAGDSGTGTGGHVFATGGAGRVIVGPTGMTINGQTAWHAGNDGSGSGVDADLLDGQHGSFFLPAATFSAAEVLSRLVTVDGSGSGVDADLLDGYHASSFDRIVDQNLNPEGGYIIYASGRKECWGTVIIAQDSYATWNLPYAHTSWCHPSFTYTGKAGFNATADNTMFVGFLGAPPYATRWYNAEDATLTIYIRTIGV